jgi:hypothetical protein
MGLIHQEPKLPIRTVGILFLFFFLLAILEFELRIFHLLGKQEGILDQSYLPWFSSSSPRHKMHKFLRTPRSLQLPASSPSFYSQQLLKRQESESNGVWIILTEFRIQA